MRAKMISVRKKNNREFTVIVDEKSTSSQHTVSLDDRCYQNLTNRRISKEKLIKRSFEFLLAREPKESILSKFNLKIINNYFPDFEDKIKT